jgi:hypothetical protein
LNRHPVIGAAAVGAGISAITFLLPATRSPAKAAVLGCALLCLLYGTLICCCWPLRRYRPAISNTLIALMCLFIGPCTTIAVASSADGTISSIEEDLLIEVAVVFCLFAVAACLPLLVAVFLRRRYWPAYPRGHCRHCGYSLRGLESRRCPECGTPFSEEEEAAFREADDAAEREA